MKTRLSFKTCREFTFYFLSQSLLFESRDAAIQKFDITGYIVIGR